jgi:hypothetical protein
MSPRATGPTTPDPAAPERPATHRRRLGRRAVVAAGLALAVAVAVPVLASAEGGAGGRTDGSIHAGTYSGEIANYGQTKFVTLVVPAHGPARATLRCGAGTASAATTTVVHGGTFTAVHRGADGALGWSIAGVHVPFGDAPDVYQVHLLLPQACDSIGGGGSLAAA